MSRLRLLLSTLALTLAGCQPGSDSSENVESVSVPSEGAQAVSPIMQEADVLVVNMTGSDQMRYNLDSFTVQPGQSIRLILTNIGKMPKAAMGHNVVFVLPGTNLNALAAAAALAKANDYIPAEYADSILVHTRMLGPGEVDTIEFTAPESTGVYPFLCSFPAHLFAGMRGEMVVEAETTE